MDVYDNGGFGEMNANQRWYLANGIWCGFASIIAAQFFFAAISLMAMIIAGIVFSTCIISATVLLKIFANPTNHEGK